MGGVRFQMVPATDAAEAEMEKSAAAIRAAVAKLAQSEAAQAAIKNAAARNAELQERFRTAAGESQPVCGEK